jgi:hypothetical protein
MFVGHYGPAFAAAAIDPNLPLAGLTLSTQVLDVAWSSFILLGVEKVRIKPGFTATNDLDLYFMPFSHGLLTALGWSLIVGLGFLFLVPGVSVSGAVLAGAVCFSHWLLDLIVHVPDLPLVGDRYKVGFGLWRNRLAALILELAVLIGGAAAFTATTVMTPALFWSVWGLTALLAALQIYTAYGPRETNVKSLAASALFAYVAVSGLAFAMQRFLA